MQRIGKPLRSEVKLATTLKVVAVYAYKTLSWNLKLYYLVAMSFI
jgi:hypothetical protein